MSDRYDPVFSPERKQARRFDTPYRSRLLTDQVYTEDDLPNEEKGPAYGRFFDTLRRFYPEPSRYNTYFGELHGHSCLSDGRPDPDDYYRHLRDTAKLDFGALTDHNHGGIGSPTLYGAKGERLRETAIRWNEPGRFTTFFAYEIEAYPYYNNAIVYHRDFTGEMFRSAVDGDVTAQELKALLARGDRLLIPHDTYQLNSGADFLRMDPALFTPLIEIYSRGDRAEYFDNPYNLDSGGMCRGGCWQDALRRGARMGCIAASDDHRLKNGVVSDEFAGPCAYPGITGVLCEENTQASIFGALKARRCYGFMGGRMWIDFRVNGHYMGEEFTTDEDRRLYFNVRADAPISKIMIVKNCWDYLFVRQGEQMVFDYEWENSTDVYYLRVELQDGRLGWTSPVWVTRA